MAEAGGEEGRDERVVWRLVEMEESRLVKMEVEKPRGQRNNVVGQV